MGARGERPRAAPSALKRSGDGARGERPRAALIDLDGTLMDTVPDLAAAVNAMRAEFGFPSLPVKRVGDFVGKGAEVLIHRALTDDMDGRAPETEFKRGRELFYAGYHRVNGDHAVVYERATEGLALLKDAGWQLACVTNKPREFTVPLLTKKGLDGFFECVVAGEDAPAKKPDPAQFLAACRLLGVSVSSSIAVGDSINDMLAARAAGCPVVLVEGGYNEGGAVKDLAGEDGVRAVVASFYEAARFLLAGRAPSKDDAT